MRIVSIIALIFWGAAFCAGPAEAGGRAALVVGNAAYANTPALANPGNDAEDVAKALSATGFKVVLKRDAGKRDFDLALAQFTRDARDAEVALFYFAGHGMQYNGANYVMPVDAALQDDVSLRYEMVAVDEVKQALSGSPGVKILVLDSCRDNPLADRLRRSLSGEARGASGPQGLAPAQPSPGMIIVYATQSGHVAMDGDARNSPFAKAFVEELAVPGLEVAALFRGVEQKVLAATEGRQSPELSISGVPEYYLVDATPDRKAWDKAVAAGDADAMIGFLSRYPDSAWAPQARERLKAAQGAEAGDAVEALFWQSTEKSGTISDYANYLKKYPGGAFASIAVSRIAELANKAPPAAAAMLPAPPPQPLATPPLASPQHVAAPPASSSIPIAAPRPAHVSLARPYFPPKHAAARPIPPAKAAKLEDDAASPSRTRLRSRATPQEESPHEAASAPPTPHRDTAQGRCAQGFVETGHPTGWQGWFLCVPN